LDMIHLRLDFGYTLLATLSEFGVSKSMEFSLQCFDTVGLGTGRASGL